MRAKLPVALVALLLSATGCASSGPLFPEPEQDVQQFGSDPLLTGLQLLRAGAYDQADKAFIRAYRTGNQPAAALTGSGIVALHRGMLTRAERYFRQASELAPGSVVAQNNLGVVLFRRGNYPQAHQAFRAAYALSSGTSDLARENMVIAEEAVRAAKPVANPQISHRLERRGSSEYLLFDIEEAESEQG